MLRKRILQLLKNPVRTETLGDRAEQARKEVLMVRLEHARLQRAWYQATTPEAQDRIEDLMQKELHKLEEIERRYFPQRTDA